MPQQEGGKGIEQKGGPEEYCACARPRDALIPNQTEAAALIEMPKRPTWNLMVDDSHTVPASKPGNYVLTGGRGHGAGGTEEGHAISGQPSPHPLPIMEVRCQQKTGRDFEVFEFSLVFRPNSKRAAVMAMKEPEEIQGGMGVEPESEERSARKAAAKKVFQEHRLFPTYYIEPEQQGQGK